MVSMRELLNQIVAHLSGALVVLLRRRCSGGLRRFVLSNRTIPVVRNGSRDLSGRRRACPGWLWIGWEFGELLGVYVVLFSLFAQILFVQILFCSDPGQNQIPAASPTAHSAGWVADCAGRHHHHLLAELRATPSLLLRP